MEVALLAAGLARFGSRGDLWVSINLSPSTLVSHREEIKAIVGSDRPVVLELTENEPINDYEAIRSSLLDLGSNVRLAVDDMGSGYASLRHVFDLRPSFMKLDHSWIRDLDGDPNRQSLVAGLVPFAAQGSAVLIAEGIETAAELSVLRSLGVRFGQGYLLGRPGLLPTLHWSPDA